MIFSTTFDGAADTVVGLPDFTPSYWTDPADNRARLTGSGGLKALSRAASQACSHMRDMGVVNQYVEVVIGDVRSNDLQYFKLIILKSGSSGTDGIRVNYDNTSGRFYLNYSGGWAEYVTSPAPGTVLRAEYSSGEYRLLVDGVVRIAVTPSGDPYAAYTHSGFQAEAFIDTGEVLRSWEGGEIVVDTTGPVLTSPTGESTGSTTASGTVSTNEATGTLYRVTTTNATETGATVKAGASQAVTSTGVQTITATGLTHSETYRHHYLHRDAAGNDSTVASSAAFTTDALDTTGPLLTIGTATVKSSALMEIGATTNEANGAMYAVLTTSATPPSSAQVRAGQNNAGTSAAWAGNQAIASTGAKTFNATGPAAHTGYYPYIVHRDASGNDSTVMSIGLRTTFRDGATGQWILDHPGSFMSQCVEAGDEDAWFDWELVTPAASGSWTDGPYADGTGVFSGPDATSMVILLRKNGVTVGNFTVSLYDSTTRVTATQAGAWSVRNLVSATQSGAWSVRNLVTATQSGAWSVEASGGTAPLTDAEMRDLYERVIALQAELQQVKAATGLIPALL